MNDSERAKLVEIVKTGKINENSKQWNREQIQDVPLKLRRIGVLRRMERGDDDPYGLAFKQIAEAYIQLRLDGDFKPVSLPYALSIDRLVELYSEVKSAPEIVDKNREYVRALARLTYGDY